MIAWMYHDSTKARRLRNSQPLRWKLIRDHALLPVYVLWAFVILIQGWFLLGDEDEHGN